jgi:CHAD domain-containing protein
LQEAIDRGDTPRETKALLLRAAGRAFDTVNARYRQVDPAKIVTIHRTRVAFKKFRYMVEALAKVLPGITDRHLRDMQTYQTRMGKIQDVEVLLARAEKFAKRTNLDLEFFRRQLMRRRAGLVSRFMANADQLLGFWPPRVQTAPRSRPKRPARSPAGTMTQLEPGPLQPS